MIHSTAELLNVGGAASRQLDGLIRLFEHNPLPAFIARTDDGKILFFNQAFTVLCGYTEQDVGLVSIADLFQGDDEIDAMIDLLVRNEQCQIAQIPCLTRDRNPMAVSVSANRLSSFSYLKNLPVDFLKIDGSFIRNIVQDPIDQSMVHSINQIGQVMGKATIAKFVENKAIWVILAKIGVNYAQGYGIGRPVMLRDIKREKP